MTAQWPLEGKVYSETIVHTAPERYASDAPYQLALIEAASGDRFTVRIETASVQDRVRIGDNAQFLEEREGVAYYSRVDL